jgi:tRNA modification GTPase
VERATQAREAADILLWLGEPTEAPAHPHLLVLHSRADERPEAAEGAIPTSVATADGLDVLRGALSNKARTLLPPPDRAALNRRQAAALADAFDSLMRADEGDLVIVAESLRQALAALDRLSGRQGTEDVLDVVFSRFCLGK